MLVVNCVLGLVSDYLLLPENRHYTTVYIFVEITKYPHHDTYDVEVDKSTKIYKNNPSQTDAIRKSLQGKFTLIQGPPG